MKKVKNIYLIGTWFFGLICGLGHLVFEIFGTKQIEIVNAMREMVVVFPGKEMDMLSITFGLSVIIGIMLLAYGLFNLIFLKYVESKVLMEKLIYLNLIVIFIVSVIVIKYLFLGPILFMGLAFVSFLRALFLVKSIA